MTVSPDPEDQAEAIVDPGLAIVDAHHHLWDDARNGRYLFDDLLADVNGGHNVLATVFVECGAMYRAGGDPDFAPVGEVEFVNGVAAMSASGAYGKARLCAGIVGTADLMLGSRVRPVLEANIQAGGGRFRGIRHSLSWDPEVMGSRWTAETYAAKKGLMSRPRFREGFACLAPLDLSFDAWVFHPQLDELLALVRAFPGTRIVINHLGGPLHVGGYAGRRDDIFRQWAASLCRLAEHPNVFVKLGGIGSHYGGFGILATSEALGAAWRPYIETCIEAFGPDRCMFESNFPVDRRSCGYAVLWNAFKRMTSGASADEKADLFSRTASRFYRLGL